MDNAEARGLLRAELAVWRTRRYAELSALVGDSHHVSRTGPSGTEYQVEIEVIWDHKPASDVRVMVSIDDFGWRAFAPLTESFILSSTDEFVGES